jgi:REP element-mobilizing transposase RayT
MPRKSRIDAPGAIHHVIARGINRQRIFLDDPDKKNYLDRLSALLNDSGIRCYAWAVCDNHFHLLLRTGTVSGHSNISVNSASKTVARGKTLAKQHDYFLTWPGPHEPRFCQRA